MSEELKRKTIGLSDYNKVAGGSDDDDEIKPPNCGDFQGPLSEGESDSCPNECVRCWHLGYTPSGNYRCVRPL